MATSYRKPLWDFWNKCSSRCIVLITQDIW